MRTARRFLPGFTSAIRQTHAPSFIQRRPEWVKTLQVFIISGSWAINRSNRIWSSQSFGDTLPALEGCICHPRNRTATLQFAVFSLSRLDHLLPAVRTLGERHAGCGVTAAHYDTVGQALLWTLEQGLGAVFTPDVKAAWAETYLLLAGVMQEATANVQMELVA